jgi:uncharacterized protein (TIGR02266 family)
MEAYSSLLEAFDALNRRKRANPDSLAPEELARWRSLRREIEQALFDHAADESGDTREHLRVPVALAVRYWTRDELKDRYIPVLGDGGLFVSTLDPLPMGTVLDLEIVLASKGFTFKVKGEVVWRSSAQDPACRGMGIRFVDLSYDQKRMIYGLVDDSLRERLLERRRFARVDAHLEVQFLFADGFFEEATDNLSLGGLFIACPQPVPVGERLRLVLHVPGARPAIKAVAEVRRVRLEAAPGAPRGMGVRFVEMTVADRLALREYLTRALGEDGEVELDDPEAERRRTARLAQRIQLRYHWPSACGVCFARDISTGGVFIQTREAPPPPGSPVEVTLTHPVTLQSMTVSGRVVRVIPVDGQNAGDAPGAAVQFDALGPAREGELRSILEYLVQLDHGAAEGVRS